jgi:hypothetical protein
LWFQVGITKNGANGGAIRFAPGEPEMGTGLKPSALVATVSNDFPFPNCAPASTTLAPNGGRRRHKMAHNGFRAGRNLIKYAPLVDPQMKGMMCPTGKSPAGQETNWVQTMPGGLDFFWLAGRTRTPAYAKINVSSFQYLSETKFLPFKVD